MLKRITYNSPVVLTFALLSLAVLILGTLTGGKLTSMLFCVYRAPLSDPLTYPRFFLHVLGHSNISHYMGNILMLLVVGPPLEEKFGSKSLLLAIAITALISGVVQFVFFPHTALLGASGIVFMMIVMLSMTGAEHGRIPLTMILVVILYIGSEVIQGIFVEDNVSQITHIIGGACGAVIGFFLYRKRR